MHPHAHPRGSKASPEVQGQDLVCLDEILWRKRSPIGSNWLFAVQTSDIRWAAWSTGSGSDKLDWVPSWAAVRTEQNNMNALGIVYQFKE